MSYKGKYQPSNPKKYKGDPTNIIYRSLWERKFMVYCDSNQNILEWGSEELALPYSTGQIKKYLIEIKPKKQTIEPIPQKRKTKGYIYEVYEYAKNQAKWKAAQEFCEDRQWEFKVLTEDELGIK